jgi:hypothetical protein
VNAKDNLIGTAKQIVAEIVGVGRLAKGLTLNRRGGLLSAHHADADYGTSLDDS